MLVNAQEPEALQDYLLRMGWLGPDETITGLEKPGEGNMNYTLRVITPVRTLIVKQARSYVEKYPSIPAPAERAVIEGRFYQKALAVPMLSAYMPELMGMDEANSVLVLEDLGTSSDYTFLYQPDRQLTEEEARALTTYLSELHQEFISTKPDPDFANRSMRALNHEHIFNYPFLEDNGFNLDTIQPGLQAVAMPYRQDAALKKIVRELGERYLADGPILLHGDYYPGSWLQTTGGVKVIDPEFCFYGPAEFDLGVMQAHLMMAQQPASIRDMVTANYERPVGFDETLLRRFTGVEIMRRLIGLAQLPLSLSLEQKRTLLEDARMLLA